MLTIVVVVVFAVMVFRGVWTVVVAVFRGVWTVVMAARVFMVFRGVWTMVMAARVVILTFVVVVVFVVMVFVGVIMRDVLLGKLSVRLMRKLVEFEMDCIHLSSEQCCQYN